MTKERWILIKTGIRNWFIWWNIVFNDNNNSISSLFPSLLHFHFFSQFFFLYFISIKFFCKIPYADQLALFCKNKKKPLMIAESTPFGGINPGDGAGTSNEAGALFCIVTLLIIFFDDNNFEWVNDFIIFWNVVFYWIELCCVVLYCTVLRCNVMYWIVFYWIELCCTALHCNALQCYVLDCILLNWIELNCVVLHCTVMHCNVMYRIVLDWIVLQCTGCFSYDKIRTCLH